MTTLNEHIAKLQAIADADPTFGELKLAGMVGSSGCAYELGSVFTQDANEEVADMLGIREGDTYVEIYLGN